MELSNQLTSTVRKYVLRFHGSILMVLTPSLTILSVRGVTEGAGPWGRVLHENGWAEVGFFQAYLLMFVLALVLWIGSFDENPWRWDIVGLLAHLPPLAINFVAKDVFIASGMVSISVTSKIIHSSFIGLELLSLLLLPSLQFLKRNP